MNDKTIAQMTAEVRQINVEKGWRPAQGGPGDNTFGDYLALLHSEVSEALEAYRDYRLSDATAGYDQESERPAKPEGVGSELADVLIRTLDMADVFGVTVRDMSPLVIDEQDMKSFGDHLAWLHYQIATLPDPADGVFDATHPFTDLVQAVYVVAFRYGIDLMAEYKRKITYNRTRPYQHGGRTLSEGGRVVTAPVEAAAQ